MIGSLGLSISVCCQWMFLYQRYRFIELKVPQIWRVNYLTYLLGCSSALGCMGVGAFRCVDASTIHWQQTLMLKPRLPIIDSGGRAMVFDKNQSWL